MTNVSAKVWVPAAASLGVASNRYATYAKNNVLNVSDPSCDQSGAGKQTFTYNDDTVVLVVEKNASDKVGDVYAGSISNIETAANDGTRTASTTNVYIISVEDTTDATPVAELILVIVPYVA